MSRRKNQGHIKTFQQRQTERMQQLNQERILVEAVVSKYTCSTSLAHDFAGQCEVRLDALEFDLLCSAIALEFWASPAERARPIVDALRELADERKRHREALARLHERLRDFTRSEAMHQHLELPIEHYQQQAHRVFFPDSALPAGPDSRGIR